jgi:plasmid maintenance system killer protein
MKYITLLLTISLLISCGQSVKTTKNTDSSHSYPPALGFNLDNSDTKAILIADEVMKAQGGFENWQNTHFIKWNFFGNRNLLWDKFTGDVRIELSEDLQNTIIVNINTNEGKAEKDGVEVTDETELDKLLKTGKSIWINDAYWLVMPFKLKDSGVSLKYLEASETMSETDVLQLTFENIGDTPQNKYVVHVDKETKLVNQWDFYSNYNDTIPRFSTPWTDYQEYGNILLSGNRGERSLTGIAVLESVEADVFTKL